MKIEYVHNLTKEESYKKAQEFFPILAQKYGSDISDPEIQWISDYQANYKIRIKGFSVKGSILLKDYTLVIEGKIPWKIRVFEPLIFGHIKKGLDELLKEST